MLVIGGLTLNHADLGAKRRLEVTEIYPAPSRTQKHLKSCSKLWVFWSPSP